MQTCLSGSAVSWKYGLGRPDLKAYLDKWSVEMAIEIDVARTQDESQAFIHVELSGCSVCNNMT